MKFLTREEYSHIHKKYKQEWYCPFCDKEGRKEQIIWEWEYWYLLHNFAPYSWDHRHIMAVPKEHIKLHYQLPHHYFIELQQVHTEVKKFFNDEHYFSFTRETLSETVRSIEHLHIHFLVGNLEWKYLRKMLEEQWYPIKQDLSCE